MILTICRLVFAVQRSRSEIADLIGADPAGWVMDDYWLTHGRSGIRVWIANDAYGVHYEVSEKAPLQDGQRAGWEKVRPGWAEKRVIWAAAKAFVSARKRAAESSFRRRIKARLRALDGDVA